MNKRDRMISILARRAGGMRTMLLVGLIKSFPRRVKDTEGGTETQTAWFCPNHSELQKEMGIKTPVYWALLRGLLERGLINKRITELRGYEYQIDFGAIEAYCKFSRIELLVHGIRKLIKGR